MGKFKVGQTVKYMGKETHIETLHGDGTCNIANPFWDWDEEAEYASDGLDYDCYVRYWITVDLSELSV